MLEHLLSELRTGDPRRQQLAAADLGDRLRSGAFQQDDADRALHGLVDTVVDRPDPDVIESALHAIDEALTHYTPAYDLLKPLAGAAVDATPQVIGSILNIVASSHDPAADDVISAYQSHPDPEVRRSAHEAMLELAGRAPSAAPARRYVTPAHAWQWSRDLSTDLAVLAGTFEERYGFPPGEHRIDGPATVAELVALTAGSLRTVMPADLVAWHRMIRAVSLPDVGNGYFLHPPDEVVADALGAGVRSVTGRHHGEVVVVGSDGGGILYALGTGADTSVYRLPPGLLTGGIYASDDARFEVIAPDLVSFLDLLRDATRRFVHAGEIVEL